MASMYVHKYRRKPNTQTKDEFFVTEDKHTAVCQYKGKIERMYNITIRFEKKPVEGGRWMIMEGEPVDRRNGKNYIKAICQPEETKQVKFPASTFAEFSNVYALESIEKSTNAVIRPLKSVATFEISGTELGVTLALSQMEEIAGSLHLDPNEEGEVDDIAHDENIFQISPVTNNASKRLVTQLERALSEHSDGICSVEDYKDAPPSIKRVLVNCLADNELDDIDEDMLFDDGSGKELGYRKRGGGYDKPSYIRVYSDGGEHEDFSGDNVETDGERDKAGVKSPNVGSLSDKLNETAITALNPMITKQQEYLKTFGLSVGYTADKVERVLQFVDEKTRPSDFLDLLNGLSETQTDDEDVPMKESGNVQTKGVGSDDNTDDDEVIILETETYDMETGKGETIKHNTVVRNMQAASNNNEGDKQKTVSAKNTSTSLPDEYREMLVRDFLQESDNNLPVEELKRRNAERQRFLKENFMKQSHQAPKPTAGPQTGSKKKGKNKKKKQNQPGQTQQQQQQSGKIELHDKQLRLDSGENRTYSQDEDQTCVLRVWNNSVKDSDFKCAPNQQDQGQFEVQTPKRKQRGDSSRSQIMDNIGNHPGPNPTYSNQPNHNWSQPLAQRHDYTHNSPNKNKQGQWNHQQHQSPRRASPANHFNQGKPTQVVTPNFTGPSQSPMSQLMTQNSEELRYIVIDGSNVAMTHGNGKCFSCKGLRICVDYFKQRGHTKITIFVPQWRQRQPSDENHILDQNILHELKDEEVLVFTPSRRIGRKMVASYDDRFVMELAEAEDGVIVSNDQYRDLMQEKWNWRKLVEERLLMYSFVRDRFMVPNDPLGRDGPLLDDFLRKQDTSSISQGSQGFQKQSHGFQSQQVHHGHQGQFQHQESDFPRINYQGQQNGYFRQTPPPQKFKPTGQRPSYAHQVISFDEPDGHVKNPVPLKGLKPMNRGGGQLGQGPSVRGLSNRSDADTEWLFSELKTIFPDHDQEEKIRSILANHEKEMDLTKLTNYCMNVFFLK